MKSWRTRTRIGVGLAVGAAAITIPLTSATAYAAGPPGAGWVPVGAEAYPSKAACEASELPNAKANGYNEVWCDDSQRIMPIYYR
ncbi:hypothetical protein AB0C93_37675 [Streptomyces sp. NPDC048518]|uniref:hypothetical protein n=1 Tax=Streptomyces sp. NPDC048518 TaxID=3155029 RepID=UPI0033F2C345